MVIGRERELVLDCYRLAREYHVSPDVFLSMPLDDVALHLDRTAELIELLNRMQRRDAE
jgi:hypothetical protein